MKPHFFKSEINGTLVYIVYNLIGDYPPFIEHDPLDEGEMEEERKLWSAKLNQGNNIPKFENKTINALLQSDDNWIYYFTRIPDRWIKLIIFKKNSLKDYKKILKKLS